MSIANGAEVQEAIHNYKMNAEDKKESPEKEIVKEYMDTYKKKNEQPKEVFPPQNQ